MRRTLLVEDDNGDVIYRGPLGPGYRLAARERHVIYWCNGLGQWSVRLVDDPARPEETEAEWGNASTLTGALRYALGALFGPIDDEYDERALLDDVEEVRYAPQRG